MNEAEYIKKTIKICSDLAEKITEEHGYGSTNRIFDHFWDGYRMAVWDFIDMLNMDLEDIEKGNQ